MGGAGGAVIRLSVRWRGGSGGRCAAVVVMYVEVGYTTGVTGTKSVAVVQVVVIVIVTVRVRGGGVLGFGLPAVATAEDVLDDLLGRQLRRLAAPRGSEDATVQIMELGGIP